MRRRIFLAGSGLIAASAAGGFLWLRSGRPDRPLNIQATSAVLDQLSHQRLTTTGQWNVYQIFSHLAQSVEYSMHGFPQHKPHWFQRSLGAVAYHTFATAGHMHHGLDQPIPGAPAIVEHGDGQQAITRLRQALQDFEQFSGTLQPHFAYGHMTKTQYALAHVLHINEHLSEISPLQ